jgi:radical SAM protein with 4Fe4S-binding SPASM domain
MCYVHNTDTSGDVEMTAEQWIEIAEKAKQSGMIFLLLTGGEPLLRKDFPEIYKALSKMGFVISINTNGSLISDEIISLFSEYPPNRVNISLYGASEDTYRSLCENPSFEKVVRNIEKLKKIGVSVRLNCVFNKYNVNDADEIYKIASEHDLIVKPAAYMYPPLRAKGETGDNQARLTPYEAAACNVHCRELSFGKEAMIQRAKTLIRLDEDSCDDIHEGPGVRCRAGSSSFWLTYDGRMLPCGMMTEPSVSLKDHAFEEAWQILREKTAEIRLPRECAVCKNREICSVCAAMCYTETGAFDKKPEYICRMTDALIDIYNEKYIK